MTIQFLIFSIELSKCSFPHFPLLELDDGNHIFSADAIIKYLLPNEESLDLRDQVSVQKMDLWCILNTMNNFATNFSG